MKNYTIRDINIAAAYNEKIIDAFYKHYYIIIYIFNRIFADFLHNLMWISTLYGEILMKLILFLIIGIFINEWFLIYNILTIKYY